MKIYLSYKQTGVELQILEKELNFFKKFFTSRGDEVFIRYLDEDWQFLSPSEILSKTKDKIDQTDIVLTYIGHSGYSEGMLLELGMAYALGKEVVILIRKDLVNQYWAIKGLSRQIYKFEKFQDIEQLLIKIFN